MDKNCEIAELSAHPTQIGGSWLAEVLLALERQDVDAAVALFGTEAAWWEHGADVTMIQRSTTHIASSNSLMKVALGSLCSQQSVAVDGSDPFMK